MEFSEVIQALVIALSGVALALIKYLGDHVVRWLDKQGILADIKSKENLIMIAVAAVEKVYISENGPAKRQEAIKRASQLLKANKLDISEEEIDSFLEANVLALEDGVRSGLSYVDDKEVEALTEQILEEQEEVVAIEE